MAELKPIIEESFGQYAGAVLQSRALVDVRDCLKPSARQIFYCLYTDNFIHSKPFKKTLKGIGSAMRMYIHGDSSCEGVIMRAGQPFAMRYPLVEVEGSYGNLMESGNWAAPRYTASRLAAISNDLFSDIKKETIEDWRDNYDDTEQYPSVLPSKGFYNIVNGTMGIGIGAASSIPAFNLTEVNKALEVLLLNPNATFEEVYCAPDFPTGAILLNENEVKDSLKDGYGKSCKLRSVIEYSKADNCLVVKEIPYGVYTNTICKELEAILEDADKNPGIERFNDLTAATPNIKIYLKKRANPDKVLRYLYKETSLQYYYGINMTMLEEGKYPKVFTWKEALQSHIDHEKLVYKRGFEFDLRKIEKRLHIVEGILIALAHIEEVIEVIKKSSSTTDASKNLQARFNLDAVQSKAILEIKLARLAHLEVEKFQKEKDDLIKEATRIKTILGDEGLFNSEVIQGWREVAKKFGDSRRTKILNIEGDDEEPKEIKQILINLSNKNNIYVTEISSLYTQRRGGVGNKFKMANGEYIIATVSGKNTDLALFFSNIGNCYHIKVSELPFEEVVPVESLFEIKENEVIRELTSFNQKDSKKNIIFFTKQGIMKKSELALYNVKRAGGLKALTLDKDDEICSIVFADEEKVGMLTARGQFVICETNTTRPIGRIAKGVKGIKLNDGDYLVSARIIPNNTKEFVSISENGYSKRTASTEFSITNRGTKGGKLHILKDNEDSLVDFVPIVDENEIVIVANSSQIKVKLNEINLLSKGAQGTRSIKMKDNTKVIGISIF